MKKIAIYLRKSREEHDETREETLARHERILLDYCHNNNLIIKKIFKEVVSGESIANRPQMQLLLDEVKQGSYDGVVVVELERLSRGNQIDQAEILEIFKKSNTKIYTLNKVFDLSDDNDFDEEFFEFGLFMSRREYKVIKRRLIRGKKQAQKEGYYIGCNLPYGFNKEKQGKGWVLVPNENAKIVQMIFNKFVNENYNLSDIRDYLNNNGIKPQKAKSWNNEMLRHLIKNKNYIGLIASDTRTDEPKYYNGKHDPIIDIELFNNASRKIKINASRIKIDKTPVNPFSSILKCSICGRTMYHRRSRNISILSCKTKGCKTISTYLDLLEKKVMQEIKNELDNFTYFLDNYEDEIQIKNQNKLNEIELIKKEIIKKENMINKCCEMLEEGIYTKEKYLSRVNILEHDINALKSNLEDLNDNIDDNVDNIRTTIPILSKVLDEYWTLDAKNKNTLLKSIIDKIEYSKTIPKQRNKVDNNFDVKIYLHI